MSNFSMFLYFMVTSAAVGATISNQLCPDGIKYITCNNTTNSNGKCPPLVEIVHFSRALQNIIVNAHNEKRNSIASGNELKLGPACRMAEMSWKPKLAQAAASDIRKYKMGTDLCNNAAASRNSRQNIASWSVYKKVIETKDLISAVQSFYNEVKNVNQTYIDSYPENYNGPKTESFARMIVDNNKAVGCAVGVLRIIHRKYFYNYLLVCNYDISYVPGSHVYAECNRAGEDCNERSTTYSNLCTS